jgi:hypothetical protein
MKSVPPKHFGKTPENQLFSKVPIFAVLRPPIFAQKNGSKKTFFVEKKSTRIRLLLKI